LSLEPLKLNLGPAESLILIVFLKVNVRGIAIYIGLLIILEVSMKLRFEQGVIWDLLLRDAEIWLHRDNR
jgi:hypothetical protein